MGNLNGKIAIVTGGAQGIGEAIVNILQQEGATIIIADKSLHKGDIDSAHYKLDVTNNRQVEEFVTNVSKSFGHIDILVNNAGISSMAEVVDMTEVQWDSVMEVNAKGVFLMSKYIAKVMREKGNGGKIINIASQAGKNGYKYMGSYVASKHAVLGLTKVLALELAADQITVNAVCPGIVETDMKRTERLWGGKLRRLDAKAIEAEDYSQVPLGRTAHPFDVANTVRFLASTEADYITGESVNVTGGMTMN